MVGNSENWSGVRPDAEAKIKKSVTINQDPYRFPFRAQCIHRKDWLDKVDARK
jgi:hypothetical protein